ncbi:MAG: S-methyl-5-thioribose-1-phosphate isomerase [Myxococcales bacterium]|nr:S-methyl-5-thioribose-1-phosphate isomerase [Myxococcales bacterium]
MRPSFETIAWRGDALTLLDQRRLPTEETYLTFADWPAAADAIRAMVVRGAPAIGITAAYAMVLAARADAAPAALQAALDGLAATRPTAVNLFWALDRMRRRLEAAPDDPVAALEAEAKAIHEEDRQMCAAMGTHGAALLPVGARVLTHCNTGALATGGDGTAAAVIRAAWRDGKLKQVYADETRPFLQGARLTAWELHRDGVPVTVITDNMAAWLMAQGEVDAVIVGADRVAANGDSANKIGTYGLAVLARAHGVPVYFVMPTSTIDLATADGAAIPIERRPDREVTHVGDTRLVPVGVPVHNPAFDVTPAEWITAIITEYGPIHPPFAPGLRAHVERAAASGAAPTRLAR